MFKSAISHFLPYQQTYLDTVPADVPLGDLWLPELQNTLNIFGQFDDQTAQFRYAPDKWSIKELLGHLTDAERVFGYRALRFARRDQTDLPGFEQDDYILPSRAHTRSLESLLAEFAAVRHSTYHLFASFNDDDLLAVGSANGGKISVLALGFVSIGHPLHHQRIITERYLPALGN